MEPTTAVCGLYCRSCGVYIATINHDLGELERIAAHLGTTADQMPCLGCRSNVLSPHCRHCEFRECASIKGLDNCEDCSQFPCAPLSTFQSQAPHRAELFESCAYRRSQGEKAWLGQMEADYRCEKCGNLNSPYYGNCKSCGHNPGNPFTGRHRELFPR